MRGQAGAGVVVRMAPVLTMSSLACRLGWVRSDVRRCSESHRTRESRRAGCLVEVANSQGKQGGKGKAGVLSARGGGDQAPRLGEQRMRVGIVGIW